MSTNLSAIRNIRGGETMSEYVNIKDRTGKTESVRAESVHIEGETAVIFCSNGWGHSGERLVVSLANAQLKINPGVKITTGSAKKS